MSKNNTNSETPKKKKHILLWILGVILVIIIAIVGFVFINANKNVKQLDIASDKTMEIISEKYTLTEKDCSEFKDIKVYSFMKFDTKQYEVEDLGNLCIMKANGGVMQMLTVILTPTQKDMPLISVDYMYMLGNRTAYVEVYDLCVDESDVKKATIERLQALASNYSELNDTVPTPAWYDDIRPAGSYKKVKSADDPAIMDMLDGYLSEYIAASTEMEQIEADKIPAKLDALEGYTHRLISEGGVSTDVFKKELGEDQTTKLFDTVMFGTGNYR